jgi:hypothetical protein
MRENNLECEIILTVLYYIWWIGWMMDMHILLRVKQSCENLGRFCVYSEVGRNDRIAQR